MTNDQVKTSVMGDPETIALAGDWHGNLMYALYAIDHPKEKGADVIAHTGDFGYKFDARYIRGLEDCLSRHDMKLFFIDGNHDDQRILMNRYERLGGVARLTDHLFWLTRGTRWSWHGERWLALGGAFSVDRHWRQPFTQWWEEETITPEQARQVMDAGPTDIMITHDCPDGVPIPGLEASSGFFPSDLIERAKEHRRLLGTVVRAVKPHFLVHGHYHRHYQAHVNLGYGGVHVLGLDCDGSQIVDNMKILTAP